MTLSAPAVRALVSGGRAPVLRELKVLAELVFNKVGGTSRRTCGVRLEILDHGGKMPRMICISTAPF